jgi:hypothetical protein
MEFERHFLLAYYEALASDTGRKLKEYLHDLRQEYLPRLVRELLLKDLAGWGSRSTFGNLERRSCCLHAPRESCSRGVTSRTFSMMS